MHITFMSSSPAPPTEFATIWKTFLTMFRLMLGLTEVDVLYDAPHPWLAVLLFVLYVVLTFVLMLTSLFALMSNTASLISQNKVWNLWDDDCDFCVGEIVGSLIGDFLGLF